MQSLFTKLWNILHQRETATSRGGNRGKTPRGFRPQIETFEERLVPAQLPVNTPGIIGGVVFLDANNNHVQDAGEKAVTGLTVTLSGKTSQNATVKVTTKTDATGAFTFFQVDPGTYTLTRGQGNQLVGSSRVGTLGGNRATSTISNIALSAGQVSINNNFAVRGVAGSAVSLRQFLNTNPAAGAPLAQTPGAGTVFSDKSVQPSSQAVFATAAASTLAGTVFADANNNGLQDNGETGIANVKLAFTGIDDSGASIFLTKTTDAQGNYQFSVARPGQYTVQVLSQPGGFHAGAAVPGSLGGLTPLNTQIYGIQMLAGSTATGYNFAELASVAAVPNAARPVIAAELVDDTAGPGGTNSDGITADVSVQGTIASSRPIVKFRASLDSGPMVNILPSLAGGKFYLNAAQLKAIGGGNLTQGTHTLHLQAIDSKGRVSATFNLAFTLDSVGPATPTLVLEQASDTGSVTTDGRTDLSTVDLVGKTTAGAAVELFQGTSTTPVTLTADASGNINFNDITLTPGVNNFTIRVRDSAGNLSQFDTFFVLNQDPTLNPDKPLNDITVNMNAAATVEDLSDNFVDADNTGTIVRLNTNFGIIDIQLLDNAAPQTVANFLNYVNSGAYTNSIFHRLAINSGGSPFVLQGGGFKVTSSATTSTFTAIPTNPAVKNEFDASRSNIAGTIAMAKVGSDPNSATDQFFFNLNNNASNLDAQNGGFTVFAKVVSGIDQRIVNTMAATPVQNRSTTNSAFNEMPVQNFNGTQFPVGTTTSNFLVVSSATVLRQTEALTYTVVSSNTGLVTASIQNNTRLTLNYTANASGVADITVRATDKFGAFVEKVIRVTVNDPNANTAPVANTTSLTTEQNNAVDVDLRTLASDVETADDALIFTVADGTNGTVTLVDGHTARFVPDQDYIGPATFSYTVKDTGKGTGAALTTGPVTIDVTVTDPNLNTPPVANTTTLTTTLNSAAGVDVDLRTLVSDVETPDDALTFTVDNATNGTVTLVDGHTARFVPAPDYVGPANFTYGVTDTGKGTGAPITTGPVTIDVTVTDPNLNTPPVANTTTLTTTLNSAEGVDVDLRTLVSDAETPDDALTFTVDNATNGTVTLVDGHIARFVPAQDYHGPATFTYGVTDTGKGTGTPITTGPVTIDVTVAE